MGGRGNSGERNSSNTSSTIPYSVAYQMYRQEMDGATDIEINPDNGHAIFMANEGGVLPVIEDFVKNVTGTDKQLQEYYQSLYPDKHVRISRSKYI